MTTVDLPEPPHPELMWSVLGRSELRRFDDGDFPEYRRVFIPEKAVLQALLADPDAMGCDTCGELTFYARVGCVNEGCLASPESYQSAVWSDDRGWVWPGLRPEHRSKQ